MKLILLQIVRLVVVMALVCVAAALATPKGRLPLALRGVAKLFHLTSDEQRVPVWKRLVAFLLVIAALLLAIL